MLKEKVGNILEKHDYAWCEWSGCFDIAGSKKDLHLFKVLGNVDSFREEQANNLKLLSDSLNAHVSLIGTHTRYDSLEDNVIYERFDIPAFTPETLDAMLDFEFPEIYRDRGGMFATIDSSKLRDAREAAGLTQSELAAAVGVTKKSIYEHEHATMRAMLEVVQRIEKVLKAQITASYRPHPLHAETKQQPTPFERHVTGMLRRIGFETEIVRQSPFNIIAKERFMILSDADAMATKIARRAGYLSSFSKVAGKPAIAITEEKTEMEIPSVSRSELKGLTARELRKIATK